MFLLIGWMGGLKCQKKFTEMTSLVDKMLVVAIFFQIALIPPVIISADRAIDVYTRKLKAKLFDVAGIVDSFTKNKLKSCTGSNLALHVWYDSMRKLLY